MNGARTRSLLGDSEEPEKWILTPIRCSLRAKPTLVGSSSRQNTPIDGRDVGDRERPFGITTPLVTHSLNIRSSGAADRVLNIEHRLSGGEGPAKFGPLNSPIHQRGDVHPIYHAANIS